MFVLRFDMRVPDFGAPAAELYQAAIEMAEWGEANGAAQLMVSEHHASQDGFLPAPLILASAMAARTKTVGIQVGALLVPLHDPVELAERMVVLDLVSGGRVSYVCAIGYRAEEYAMFGRDMKRRGKRMDECLEVLQRAFRGERFEYEGRPVHVTPAPQTPGGPMLLLGGNSPAAVKRAARFGLGMITQGGDPSLEQVYRDACEEAGTTPGMFVNPPSGAVTTAFVAEDPDEGWEKIGPHLLHDARMYAEWMGDAGSVTKSVASDVTALRAENGPYRVLSVDEAIEQVRTSGVLMMQPLCGGLRPELAWESLRLVAEKVLPAVRGE